MDEIVTAEIPAPAAQREPSDAEMRAAGAVLEELSREAAALGDQPAAAPVHYAMGRVYGDRLGDPRSAAPDAPSRPPAHAFARRPCGV